jgi:uncharacterized protein (TIGR03382 family)
LNFATGAVVGVDAAGDLVFAPGGAIDIVLPGGTTAILSGTFDALSLIVPSPGPVSGTLSLSFQGALLDIQNPDINAFYGLPDTLYDGALNLTFDAVSVTGGIESLDIISANVVTTPVPEEGTPAMLGFGLAALVALVHRRGRGLPAPIRIK